MRTANSVLLAGIAATTLLVGSPAAHAEAGEYSIDASHSAVLFKIRHLETSWFYGRFNHFSGKISFDEQKPEEMTIGVTVKAASIDTGNTKRDLHLKSPDFFNAKQFPKITFKSQKVKRASEGNKTYEVSGELTLHGVTKNITVQLTHVGSGKGMSGGKLVGFHTNFTIKRSDFGMGYMQKGLGDDVEITVSLEAVQK
ncbi:MAG: YceI family protein [Phycisphaerae bacterium]|nr:YceI family protein [Phycisphaerae bacterium]